MSKKSVNSIGKSSEGAEIVPKQNEALAASIASQMGSFSLTPVRDEDLNEKSQNNNTANVSEFEPERSTAEATETNEEEKDPAPKKGKKKNRKKSGV